MPVLYFKQFQTMCFSVVRDCLVCCFGNVGLPGRLYVCVPLFKVGIYCVRGLPFEINYLCVFQCLFEALPVCMFEGFSGLCRDHDGVC